MLVSCPLSCSKSLSLRLVPPCCEVGDRTFEEFVATDATDSAGDTRPLSDGVVDCARKVDGLTVGGRIVLVFLLGNPGLGILAIARGVLWSCSVNSLERNTENGAMSWVLMVNKRIAMGRDGPSRS